MDGGSRFGRLRSRPGTPQIHVHNAEQTTNKGEFRKTDGWDSAISA
jgi:hypothetical protein